MVEALAKSFPGGLPPHQHWPTTTPTPAPHAHNARALHAFHPVATVRGLAQGPTHTLPPDHHCRQDVERTPSTHPGCALHHHHTHSSNCHGRRVLFKHAMGVRHRRAFGWRKRAPEDHPVLALPPNGALCTPLVHQNHAGGVGLCSPAGFNLRSRSCGWRLRTRSLRRSKNSVEIPHEEPPPPKMPETASQRGALRQSTIRRDARAATTPTVLLYSPQRNSSTRNALSTS